MTNGESQTIVRDILRAIAREYRWFPEGRRPQITAVTLKNGQLIFEGVPLRAESETKFFAANGATFMFVRDANGRVIKMINDAGPMTMTAKRLD